VLYIEDMMPKAPIWLQFLVNFANVYKLNAAICQYVFNVI